MLMIIRRLYLIFITVILIAAISFAMRYDKTSEILSVDATESEPVHLPIIMYHEVKYKKLGKDAISPYEFESDLKFLQNNQYHTITMTQLIDYVYHDEPLPEKPIILTFDDGYLNNYRFVLPLIKQYQVHIVFSLIGKNTDDFTEYPSDNIDYSHVTWDQLNEMIDSGYVEVQNHTYNLHSNKKGKRTGCMQDPNESLDDYQLLLTRDILILQDKLLTKTGQLPNTFTYPYGKSSEKTDEILKKLGFRATLSCNYGINVITKDPEVLFGLKRISRSHGTTMEKVLKDASKTIKNKSK